MENQKKTIYKKYEKQNMSIKRLILSKRIFKIYINDFFYKFIIFIFIFWKKLIGSFAIRNEIFYHIFGGGTQLVIGNDILSQTDTGLVV